MVSVWCGVRGRASTSYAVPSPYCTTTERSTVCKVHAFCERNPQVCIDSVSIGENHVVLKVHVWSRIRHVGTRR